jgi:hypothetical protein
MTGAPVERIDEFAPARAILLDLTPRQVLGVAGHRLVPHYRRALEWNEQHRTHVVSCATAEIKQM